MKPCAHIYGLQHSRTVKADNWWMDGVCASVHIHTCTLVHSMVCEATHSFPQPSDPTRRNDCRWREANQGCTVSSVLCTEGVRTRGRWERSMLSGTYRGKVSGLNCKWHYKVQWWHANAIDVQQWSHLWEHTTVCWFSTVDMAYNDTYISAHFHSNVHIRTIHRYLLLPCADEHVALCLEISWLRSQLISTWW